MSGFRALPGRTQAFVTAVTVAAVALSAYLAMNLVPSRVPAAQLLLLLPLLAAASLLSELKEISTPSGNTRTIVSSLFIASILLLGPSFTVPVVLAAALGSHLVLRRPWFKAAFNTSQYVLTVGLSGLAYRGFLMALNPQPNPTSHYDDPQEVLALAVLVVTYFMINSGLVAAVVALTEGRPILYVWNLSHLEMLAQYSAMVVVGVIIAILWEVAPWSVTLVAVVLLAIYTSFSVAGSLQVAQQSLLHRMDELQRRTTELTLLNEVASALVRAPDLAQFWETMWVQASRLVDTTTFVVAVQDESTGMLRIEFGRDGNRDLAGQTLPLDQDIVCQVYGRRAPVLVDLDEAPGLPSARSESSPWGCDARSVLGVPLTVDPDVCGVLIVRSARVNAYSPDDVRLLASIAAQASMAIERSRLQREAAEARALHQLNVLKAEFVSSVSHELRSPLTPIVGFAELLLLGPIDPAAVRSMAGEIYREAQHLQKLVDDLLDVSRMEAGRFRIDVTEVDLDALLGRGVREFARQSERHQVRYIGPATLPMVPGDPVRLRQVLDNLLSNAIKYSPEGGPIEVDAQPIGPEILLSIRDHGVGIESDKLGRLFEKFHRIDNKATRAVRGTGLGLAIAKHIVEAHGGRIWAESLPGQGSVFRFTLPLEPTPEQLEPDFSINLPSRETRRAPNRRTEENLGTQAHLVG